MTPENYISRQENTAENYIDGILEKAKGKTLVIGFNGSNNKDPGKTRELLGQVLQTVEDQGGLSILVDLTKIKMDTPSSEFGKKGARYEPERRNDDIEDIRTLVMKADGFILATPVYWFSHSSLVQRLMEHLTPLEEYEKLEGKVAGIIATEDEEGAGMVIAQMMLTLTHFGMIIAPYSGIFSRGHGRDYKWVREDVSNLGTRIMKLIDSTKGINWDIPNSKPEKI